MPRAIIFEHQLLFLATLLAAGCGPGDAPVCEDPFVPPGVDSQPLFRKPFLDDYPTINMFDHELPFPWSDRNGYQHTWRGALVVGGIEGHAGYDWKLPEGTNVLAVAAGTVVFAGETEPRACPFTDEKVAERVVTIRHSAARLTTSYLHLGSVTVEAGRSVEAGQKIGESGNSGCSTVPHLHFEVAARRNGWERAFDPYGWAGLGEDPWRLHQDGVESIWLWKPGQAPSVCRSDD